MARLPGIYKVARRHHAVMILDEAHGTGVFGSNGAVGRRSISACTGKSTSLIGTLSKSHGRRGFCRRPQSAGELFETQCLAALCSGAATPPSVCAGVLSALEVIKSEPIWLRRLHENARQLRQGLRSWQGWDTGLSESLDHLLS